MNHHDTEEGASRNEPSLEQLGFPYAVFRHFPAVYERMPVRFVGEVVEPTSRGPVLLVHSGHLDAEPSAHHRRAGLLGRLLELSRRSGERACAVFGPGDAVYVEPSGETRASTDVPMGGTSIPWDAPGHLIM